MHYLKIVFQCYTKLDEMKRFVTALNFAKQVFSNTCLFSEDIKIYNEGRKNV